MSHAQEVISQRVDEILALSGQTRPPIQLRSLYAHRRIQTAYPSNLQSRRAQLIPSKNGFILQYKDMGLAINRFSIAHEIGHTYYYDLTNSPPSRIGVLVTGMADEEKFCDLFAAELLMPSRLVREAVTGGDYSQSISPNSLSLLNIAGQFKVSVRVAAKRLVCDLSLWDAVILCCQWAPSATSGDKEPTDSWAWRGIWGYKPELYGKSLYLPSFRKLPHIRLHAVTAAYEAFVRGEIQDIGVYSEALSNMRLGNLASFLRKQVHREEWQLSATSISFDKGSFIDEFAYGDHAASDPKKRCRVIVVIPLRN